MVPRFLARVVFYGRLMMVKTKNSDLSGAEICRRNHWRRGTILVGKEDGKSQRLRITAVGDYEILAVLADDPSDYESQVDLTWQNWKQDLK